MVDLRPSDHTRLEVAFTTMPDDANPAWVDLTSRLDLSAAWSRTYGAQDEFSSAQPATCQVAVDNRDGALTPGNVASPFYPNVRPQRKVRLFYRDPTVSGNLLSVEDSSFDGGTLGAWFALGTGSAAADTARFTSGAYSMRIDWVVTASTSGRRLVVPGLTIGRTYTLSADMFVPTGGEAVSLNINGIGLGVQTSTTNAWQRLTTSFTATAVTHTVNVFQLSVGTAYSSWVDSIMIDEGTSSTFTTAAPPVTYLFTGHVEEWPTEWPGGQLYSQTAVTATDRLARIGSKRAMRSVIEEAILHDAPQVYFPLGEPEGSTLAGDVSGSVGVTPLSTVQYGSGGTLDFGTSTGPPTDALPAPTFTPSGLNGKYLSGSGLAIGFTSSITLRASFLTSLAAKATVARISDAFGTYVQLEVTAAGKVRASMFAPFAAADAFSLTSAATVSNGATHDVVVTLAQSGGTVTVVLYLDGVDAGSTSFAAVTLSLFTAMNVGGHSRGDVFTGTISHVAAFNAALTSTQVTDENTAVTTGFEGERSDQRIARYASWAGVPTVEQALDVGSSTSIAFTDTTGQSILQAMQDVAQTEGGRLFVNGAGVLTFHARSRRYANPAAVATVSARMLSGSEKFTLSTQGLVNDLTGQRPDGPQTRAYDAASIAEFGVFNQSLTLLATADSEVADAINWRVSTNAQPEVRLPQGTFDLYTDATTGAALRAVELGDRVSITNLPSQAPASTMDFTVEGYSENVSVAGWTRTANLSNYSDVQGLTLDDNVYGLLDSDNRLVY